MKKLKRITVEVVLEDGTKMTLDFDNAKALKLVQEDTRLFKDVVEQWRRSLDVQTR